MRQKLSDTEIQTVLNGLPGWARAGETIVKTFKFTKFADGIAFVQRVARVADEMDHHPDIDIRYTSIRMSLSTHDAGEVTATDAKLATRGGKGRRGRRGNTKKTNPKKTYSPQRRGEHRGAED